MNKNDAQQHYIDLGCPTMSLNRFYSEVLCKDYFDQDESYDRVLMIGLDEAACEILQSLLAKGLKVSVGATGYVVIPLKNNPPYPQNWSITREGVKNAFSNLSKERFPWLNLDEKLVLLKTNEHIRIEEPMAEETLGKRDMQIHAIIKVALSFGYDLQNIPEKGKQLIKAECLKKSTLFTDSGFDHAWRKASSRKIISIENKEKYLKKQ
jgi:hypothetical protein